MSYTIKITNPGNHIANPLLKLAHGEYETREEACEAIYSALYDIINSEDGWERADKAKYSLDNCRDEDGNIMFECLDEYDSDCHNYILDELCASHDGVTATVEECE